MSADGYEGLGGRELEGDWAAGSQACPRVAGEGEGRAAERACAGSALRPGPGPLSLRGEEAGSADQPAGCAGPSP